MIGRTLQIYRENVSLDIKQIRLGRIIAEEHKGHLDHLTDAGIFDLLSPSNEEQYRLDLRDLREIQTRQKEQR